MQEKQKSKLGKLLDQALPQKARLESRMPNSDTTCYLTVASRSQLKGERCADLSFDTYRILTLILTWSKRKYLQMT